MTTRRSFFATAVGSAFWLRAGGQDGPPSAVKRDVIVRSVSAGSGNAHFRLFGLHHTRGASLRSNSCLYSGSEVERMAAARRRRSGLSAHAYDGRPAGASVG